LAERIALHHGLLHALRQLLRVRCSVSH
jgi:hypothetical protein